MVVPEGRLYGCPIELALDMIGGKWKTVILARLKDAPLRYGELRRAIPTLADKVELEDSGLVERSDRDGASVYALTARGLTLGPALEALYAWGQTQGNAARARFCDDERTLLQSTKV